MTDGKDDPNKGFTPSAAPLKKPAPIIDLKATVVDQVKSATASGNPFGTSGGGSAPASAPGATAPVPPSAKPSEPPRPTAKAQDPVKPSVGTPAKPLPVRPAAGAGGIVSHMTAGVAGAILTLLGAQALSLWPGADGAPPDLQKRLAVLEQAGARPGNDTGPRLAANDARLAKLEDAAQALANGQVKIAAETQSLESKLSAQSGGVDAATRLVKLEEQLAAMVNAAAADPRAPGRLPQLAQLTAKIGEIETALATRTATVKTELQQQIDQRFTRTGEQAEANRALLAQRTQSVELSVKAVTDETTSLRAGVDALKIDLDARFRNAAKPADVQSAVAVVATKLATMETSMQGVVKSEQERNAATGNILLSLELANLKRALDRGGKYGSELDAVRKLAGPKLDLGVLDAQKDAGVPGLTTLGAELAGLAHGMLDAEAEPADASLGDRMLSGFKSIVRVRKVNHAPDDKSTEALIARMELAVKEGRLGDVLEQAKALPAKAAVPADKWLKRIESRAAIDKAMTDLDASLKVSLAGGATPKKGTNP